MHPVKNLIGSKRISSLYGTDQLAKSIQDNINDKFEKGKTDEGQEGKSNEQEKVIDDDKFEKSRTVGSKDKQKRKRKIIVTIDGKNHDAKIISAKDKHDNYAIITNEGKHYIAHESNIYFEDADDN